MGKSRDAFRTISEVAEWLDTPAHVLRFWESKFTQIKPVKRAGGRRYYRPEDMALLAGIKVLLHEQGLTIKGAQKLIREKGVTAVAGIGDGYFDDSDDEIDLQPDTAAQPEPDADTALDDRDDGDGGGDGTTKTPASGEKSDTDRGPDQGVTLTSPDSEPRVVPFAMPPAARSPESVRTAAPVASAMARPHLFSAIGAADRATLAGRASRLRPLLGRLADLRGKLSGD